MLSTEHSLLCGKKGKSPLLHDLNKASSQCDGKQTREVLSLATRSKRCWEMDEGVEGSEQTAEQLTRFGPVW